MSTVTASGHTNIDVSFSHFGLVLGVADDDAGGPSGDDAGEDELFRAAGSELLLFSAASNHTASVLVEFLTEEPEPVPDGDDVVSGRAGLTLGAGPATVFGIADGFVAEVVGATPFQGPAGLEVRCAGREETRRRQLAGEYFFSGVERWTILVWPRG